MRTDRPERGPKGPEAAKDFLLTDLTFKALGLIDIPHFTETVNLELHLP